ncbi:SCP2 sterol-binding domain-containing protein [Endozoicomonadaceae bacterium StTr2]
MSTAAEAVAQMKEHFNPEAAAGLDLVYEFDMEDGDTYHLIVKDGTCDLIHSAHESPDVTLVMTSSTMKGILSGSQNPMMAFMTGKIRCKGNMMLATKLGDLFG